MTSPAIRSFANFAMTGVILLGVALMTVTSVHAQMSISSDKVTFPDGTSQTTGIPGKYVIGDIGPAGGFVFYVTADRLHGLEAAPADQSTGAPWGCAGTDIPGAGGTAIGTGESNSEDINDPVHGCGTDGIAAAVAAAYVSPSGYFDWYLPAKDELIMMHDNLHDRIPPLGGFVTTVIYWSSTESSNVNSAASLSFLDGFQGEFNKANAGHVRAVRAF